jgi:hypothetical protein
MKVRESDEKYRVYTIELEEDDQVQLLVPASMERTAVHLEVMNGKLVIAGGSSVISEISGDGMREKFKN